MADVIFRSGTVLTMNEARPVAESLAVRGTRITAVGSDAEIAGLETRRTKVIDLAGAVLLPGFHDSHVYLTGLSLKLGRLDLDEAASSAEALELVKAWQPRGEWILGAGFSLSRWGVDTLLATDLDMVANGRPAVLRSQDHHSAWLNTEALRRLGITADTPDPESGRIQRDGHGNPSGLLFESAVGLALDRMPPETDGELDAALIAGAKHLASLGITTVHHMAAEPASWWRAIARVASDCSYPIRVWSCLDQEHIEAAASMGVATGQGGSRFMVGGAKFFADGALGSLTAWMSEPYEGTDDRGIAMHDPAELEQRVRLAAEAGLVPVAHAIGDEAVRVVLDAYEATRDAWSPRGLRPRLEHAQHMHASDLARLARLGVIASVQPIHLTFDGPAVPRLLGERADRAYMFRRMADAGAHLAFGSDAPVAPASVVQGLLAATSRVDASGEVFGPSELLGIDESLAAYTRGAAYAIGREARSGKLEAGFDADLVVMSDDPRSTLNGLDVLMTFKAGNPTYTADALDQTRRN